MAQMQFLISVIDSETGTATADASQVCNRRVGLRALAGAERP
jgi:hypothetical protein